MYIHAYIHTYIYTYIHTCNIYVSLTVQVLPNFASAFSCCRRMGTGTQFTCFTGTKVQILTLSKLLPGCTMAPHTAFLDEAGLTHTLASGAF